MLHCSSFMREAIHIGVFDAIIFLGVFQGLLLTFFFLRNTSKGKTAYLYQGLLLMAFSLALTEEFLNNTGYIVRALAISNFAEPLNLAYGPLLYLYVARSIRSQKEKKDILHFLLFFLYLLYMGFFFFQPEAVKYNAFLHSKHPNLPSIPAEPPFSEDPLGIRRLINPITALHVGTYLTAALLLIRKTQKQKGSAKFEQRGHLQRLRQSSIHFLIIIALFVFTKIYFGRDLGDYFIATYITVMFYTTLFQVMWRSHYFESPHPFLEVPANKYKKSSLTNDRKEEILSAIIRQMDEHHYYTHPLASLNHLASTIQKPVHHVSQVINEKMQKSFFEMLAHYRIEAAKKMLEGKDKSRFTIEEIAENVGYNSKSSFNTAFKKLTGLTPSQYRKNNASF